jgi:hypothetical protein
MTISNAPESEAITSDDYAVFEAARENVLILKKTFAMWLTIGKAVVRARDIADRRGGGKTFMRLLEQQGLGEVIDKSTASNLLRVREDEREVRVWHATLTSKQQIEWAAPRTILRRCPVFKTPAETVGDKPPTKGEKDRMALAQVIEENERLKKLADNSIFAPTDTVEDMTTAILANVSADKAERLARSILDRIKHKRKKPAR